MRGPSMISPLVIERPGKWRGIGVVFVFLLALFPIIAAVASMGFGETQILASSSGVFWSASFLRSLGRSVLVGGSVSAVSVFLGLPIGVWMAAYSIPFRRILIVLLVLPLLVPSFLWAIGVSMLRISLEMPSDSLFSGFSGTVMVFSSSAVPLVVLATWASAKRISQSEADAARLSGGEARVLVCIARSVFPMAVASGVLAGVLTLSDPGPGQILGYDSAASQVLVSFAAQYDFAQATWQSMGIGLVVLMIALPLAVLLAPRMASALLSRSSKPLRPVGGVADSGGYNMFVYRWGGFVCLSGLIGVGSLLPLVGLIQPLIYGHGHGWHLPEAIKVVNRSAFETFYSAILAGVVGMLMGAVMALCAGREKRWRTVALAGALVVFSMPPALSCLGVMNVSGELPASFDVVFRSWATASFIDALRFFPISLVLMMRAMGNISPDWTSAAALHGVSIKTYFFKVLLPWLAPVAGVSVWIISLLSMGDISVVHLLAPPGGETLPLAIFTIMANAPETLVSTLCLIYIGSAITVILLVMVMMTLGIQRKKSRSIEGEGVNHSTRQ